jgi:hypothetical protein
MGTPQGLQDMTCIRCGQPAQLRFYGPCASCVEELHAKFAPEPKEIGVDEYVPKMNVTPNAVALKDD